MCGIFGAVSFASPFHGEDFLRFSALTDLVHYRGPDAKKYIAVASELKEINQNNFNVFLGHRRLSIIDLSDDGIQPMYDDENYLIFNGEIFNYLEIREELENLGETFRTKTDSEVILKTYKWFGTAGFSKFNGMWAFAILDLKKQKIILSRDRFAMKPLFYLKENSTLFFASEIKQLSPLLNGVKINEKKIFNFLQQGIIDHTNDTFLEQILRVEAKHNYIVDLKTQAITQEKYWDFDRNITLNSEDTLDKFKFYLNDSIRLRLRSDVEVGSLLSGGLDSSSITIIAKELTQNNIKTFSVVSKNDTGGEEKFIDILTKSCNIKNEKYFITPAEILDQINDVIYHQDEPFNTLSIVAQYAILKKIKLNSGITVVLSGQGGDEVLMGYLKYYFFYLNNLMKHKKFITAGNEIVRSFLLGTAIRNYQLSLAKRYIPFMQKKTAGYLTARGVKENIWSVVNLTDRQMKDIDSYSVPILARYEDRNSMAHSVETRHPFLDHRLVNFSINLNPAFKIKDGWTKYILRKSMTQLPPKIRWRRDKLGFTIPEDAWYKNELKNEIMDAAEKSILARLGFIDKKLFVDYFKTYLNGNKTINYSDISRVFITEKWLRNLLGEKN
jgi:asparagine synthase (glutamine-hydrolysing)